MDASHASRAPQQVIVQRGHRLELDLSAQRLRLEITADDDAPLSPVPVRGRARARFVSGAMLVHKAKQFDDGLVAALHLMAEDGLGKAMGVRGLFRALRPALAALRGGAAAKKLFAAAAVGNAGIRPPPHLRAGVRAEIERFRADELRSRPLGVYTWSAALGRIFQQHRLLQAPLESDRGGPDQRGLRALARALHADGEARVAYEAHLGLRQCVTNPPAKDRHDLRYLLEQLDRGERLEPIEGTAFFPSARSHETDLLRSFASAGLPEGFDAVEAMVARIRRGQLDLRPGPTSGFYDYQVWALEPLLIPEQTAEARHLAYGHDYRHALEELFKGALALARETHVRDLAVEQEEDEMEDEDLVFRLAPRLSVEPLCTHYLRRAAGYRFLHDRLVGLLGREVLAGLARQTPEGPVSVPLGEELLQMAALFMGAFSSASREIGADSDVPRLDEERLRRFGSGAPVAQDEAAFRSFAKGEGDLDRDARMMVPLLRRTTGWIRVWVFLGWRERVLEATFAELPRVRVLDSAGRDVTRRVEIERLPALFPVAVPEVAELDVPQLLDREKFRALCDEHRRPWPILRALARG